VVYLDADAIAARNMDELFLCDGLCAVMRHSERVNTGTHSASGAPACARCQPRVRSLCSHAAGSATGSVAAPCSCDRQELCCDMTRGALLSRSAGVQLRFDAC
jgi:hypothetical protein